MNIKLEKKSPDEAPIVDWTFVTNNAGIYKCYPTPTTYPNERFVSSGEKGRYILQVDHDVNYFNAIDKRDEVLDGVQFVKVTDEKIVFNP